MANLEAEDDPLSVMVALSVIGGILCLIAVLVLCVCNKRSKQATSDNDVALRVIVEDASGNNPATPGALPASSPAQANGGLTSNQSNAAEAGHSRQASSGSASHLRPTSLRELPEPPTSPHHTSPHHPRNGGGDTLPSNHGTGGGDEAYGFHHYQEPREPIRGSHKGGTPGSDGYAHLGHKPTVKPTDYDSLAELPRSSSDTPTSEVGSSVDGHYAKVKDRTYAVVKDVKKKKMYDPYSRVKDDDDDSSHAGSNYYSQEDPYNHIGESDGAVPPDLLLRIHQSADMDDPYATLADDEGGPRGDTLGAVGGLSPSTGLPPGHHLLNPDGAFDQVTDEYAVVHKTLGTPTFSQTKGPRSEGDPPDMTPYSIGPPEPPRRYHLFQEEEEHDDGAPRPDHKYSKVSARESLASIQARHALNPYESVADVPENTYATVDGGSGDGVVGQLLRVREANRERPLSQASDTYAEIAISGGGGAYIGGASCGGASSPDPLAPAPPSLDSLHLMTKSQTSSDGDRLSDHLLTSPDDSRLSDLPYADQPSSGEGEGSEDGYSTLRRSTHSSPPGNPHQRGVNRSRDASSGEVTLTPNYQTVKDCISHSSLDDLENDPNYESVDDARSQFDQGRQKASELSSPRSRVVMSPVQLVQFPPVQNGVITSTGPIPVINSNYDNRSQLSTSVQRFAPPASSTEKKPDGYRRRKRSHDYEEVDMPTSPRSLDHSTRSPDHSPRLSGHSPRSPDHSGSSLSPHFPPIRTPTTGAHVPHPNYSTSPPQNTLHSLKVTTQPMSKDNRVLYSATSPTHISTIHTGAKHSPQHAQYKVQSKTTSTLPLDTSHQLATHHQPSTHSATHNTTHPSQHNSSALHERLVQNHLYEELPDVRRRAEGMARGSQNNLRTSRETTAHYQSVEDKRGRERDGGERRSGDEFWSSSHTRL